MLIYSNLLRNRRVPDELRHNTLKYYQILRMLDKHSKADFVTELSPQLQMELHYEMRMEIINKVRILKVRIYQSSF